MQRNRAGRKPCSGINGRRPAGPRPALELAQVFGDLQLLLASCVSVLGLHVEPVGMVRRIADVKG
jgi:hypothetical protein